MKTIAAPLRALAARLSSGLSLAARLGAVVCVLSVPIISLASDESHKLGRASAQSAVESSAVAWIGLLVRAMEDVGASPKQARATDRDLEAVQRFAAAHAATLPAARAEGARFRAAFDAARKSRNGAALARLMDVADRAVSRVSDDSHLSFESDFVIADLGDVLDNSYLLLFGSLSAAGETTGRAIGRDGLSLDDRIIVAGLLARAHGSEVPLASDMTNAFDERASLRPRLAPLWSAALQAAHQLEGTVSSTIRSPHIPNAGVAVLDLQRARFAARSERLFAGVQAEALAALVARRDREASQQRLVWLAAALAIVFVMLLCGYVSLLIARRDRRALERAEREAHALSVELARQRAERERMLTKAQFDAVFKRSQMGIALLDRLGATIECNPALSAILGSATPGIVPPRDRAFAELAAGRAATYQYEGPLRRVDGTVRWAQVTVSSLDPLQVEDVVAIAMVQDISERRAIDERLRYETQHDHLTSLPNRPAFLEQVAAVLARGDVLATYAVLFIDLDKFKLVNDTLGHTAGDRAIAIAAQRLIGATRLGDVVARLHGDEFAVLLRCGDEAIPGTSGAERVRAALRAPIALEGTPIVLTASIGIVSSLEGYTLAEDVVRDADVAMYNAKKLGRSTSVVFDGAMQERLGTHVRMMSDLHVALERNELSLVYQPIVDLADGRITGIEALMRWRHPTLGSIPPIDFIPVAEESDLIQELGRFALEAACAMLARLDRAGSPPLGVSVNLSVAHIRKGRVVDDVREALERSGIAASRVTLEITESGLLDSGSEVPAVLDALSALGVRLCIDDFGTGYSALRYLHEYPIDVLKIDRSFIAGDEGTIANDAIVHMLLTLARSLGIVAIAEGIETEAQRHALVESGCRFAQGFLFAPGLSEAELAAWISQRRELELSS